LNENVVFAAGDMPHPKKNGQRIGVVVRTTDGGETWKETLLEQADANIVTINSGCFVSPNTGWLAGVDSGQVGVVLKTTDGGDSWSAVRVRFSQLPTTIFFIDEQTGWMGGATPLLAPSESGKKPGGRKSGEGSPIFSDEDSPGGPSDILHTTDGGRTWQPQRRVPITITDIFFLDKNRGWAGGYKGVIYTTTDGGRTWDAQRSELEVQQGTPDIPEFESVRFIIHGIYFFDPQNGFAAAGNEDSSGGRALGTTNGGATWATRWIVNGSGVHTVAMVSPSEAWASVSKERYVYRTVDGGRTWLAEPIEFEQQITLFRIRAIGASNVWAVGDGGIFKRVE
jgi:photosystem II stability/assembly factor-like uncharacterized protein